MSSPFEPARPKPALSGARRHTRSRDRHRALSHADVPAGDGQSIVELARQSKNPAIVQAVAGEHLVVAKVVGGDASAAPLLLIANFVAAPMSTNLKKVSDV